MKYRRIWNSNLMSWVPQRLASSGGWEVLSDESVLPEKGRYAGVAEFQDGDIGLPFQPLTFRDFMLYERHVVDATRGYAKRFMPPAYRLGQLYERLTGSTFPSYRPSALWFRQPIYYMGNPLTFVPSGKPVTPPSYTHAFDYELELGFVLARPLLNASVQEAVQAIGAFVVICDFSARDMQKDEMNSGFGPQKAKHFFSSLSAHATTAEEVLADIQNLNAKVEINGRVVATPSTRGMKYSLGEVLAFASKDEQLYPGELFGTGTLPGGSGMENGHWLQRGDTLSLSIDRVGDLHHTIC